MELTPENKKHIDDMSYEALLGHWRFAPIGDRWFQGETGEYWCKKIREMRSLPETDHVAASKSVGWEK